MTTIEDYVIRCAALERERDEWKASHDALINVITRLYAEIDRCWKLQDAHLIQIKRIAQEL